jgi:hypothetical protein
VLDLIRSIATTVSPEIIPIISHLEQSRGYSPHDDVSRRQDVSYITRYITRLIGEANTADIGADYEEAHPHIDCGDGEEHISWPESGIWRPHALVAFYSHVSSEEKLCKRISHGAQHITTRDKCCEARYEAKDADLTLIFLCGKTLSVEFSRDSECKVVNDEYIDKIACVIGYYTLDLASQALLTHYGPLVVSPTRIR